MTILQPSAEEEEDNKQKTGMSQAEQPAEPELKPAVNKSQENLNAKQNAGTPLAKNAAAAGPADQVEQEVDEKKDEEPEEPPFRPNDFLQKAEMEPPHDPMGNPSLQGNLTISVERIVEILDSNLHKALTWIMTEKQLYEQKVNQEVKDLQDKSVEELDENLRK